jgi:hypothetical protein
VSRHLSTRRPRVNSGVVGLGLTLSFVLLCEGCGASRGPQTGQAAADRRAAEREARDEEGRKPAPPRQSPVSAPSGPARERGAREVAFIRAADQAGDGSTISIEEIVFVRGPGWVVIHSGPDIVGVSHQLPAGTSRGITVSLATPLRSSARVLAMLHTEDNQNANFDFPASDAPALHDGVVIAVPVQVSVA